MSRVELVVPTNWLPNTNDGGVTRALLTVGDTEAASVTGEPMMVTLDESAMVTVPAKLGIEIVPPPLVALAAGALLLTVSVVAVGTDATVNVPLKAPLATPAIVTVVPTVRP
jgi:hypothetical protein